MKFIIYTLSTAVAFGLTLSSKSQQPQLNEQNNWVGLNAEARMRLIDQAADAKQSEPLYAAMHNASKKVQIYCVGKMALLPTRQQAELLARILMDDGILWRDDEFHIGGIEGVLIQIKVQQQIQLLALQLLHRNTEPLDRMLTRAEATSLATQLRSVQ